MKKRLAIITGLLTLFTSSLLTISSASAEIFPRQSSSEEVYSAAAEPFALTGLPTGFRDTVTLKGLKQPTVVRFAKDGRIFVAEKRGVIKVFSDLNDTDPTTFADLRPQVMDYWDRGLLGMTLHPNFPQTPYVYVLYTLDAPLHKTPPIYNDTCSDPTDKGCVVAGRLSRLKASGDRMTGSEEKLIEDWCNQYPSHTIGNVEFGKDGALYVSGGDGASFDFVDYGQKGNPCADPTREGGALRSQDIRTKSDASHFHGSILRLTDTGRPQSNNPLIGGGHVTDDRVVAYGMRNPFRFTQRPGTNELWIGDVGWYSWEEINRITNPADSTVENFGWPCYEGTGRHPEYDAANLALCESLYSAGGQQSPYYTYSHNGGTGSITGLSFYQSGNYPAEYRGALFFTDFSKEWIKVMLPGSNGLPASNNIKTFIPTNAPSTHLTTGPNGDIFWLDLKRGELHRIEYGAVNRPPTADAVANKTGGELPLTVQFKGTNSKDPDNDPLTYAWDLDGDGQFDDSTSPTPVHTYTVKNKYTVKLRVSDGKGATAEDQLTILAGNEPPVVTISSPSDNSRFTPEKQVNFAASAVDPDYGDVPAENFTWTISLYHCAPTNPNECHIHQIQETKGVKSGSITAPSHDKAYHIEFKVSVKSEGHVRAKYSKIYPAD